MSLLLISPLLTCTLKFYQFLFTKFLLFSNIIPLAIFICFFIKILWSYIFFPIFFLSYFLNITSSTQCFISNKILEKVDINKWWFSSEFASVIYTMISLYFQSNITLSVTIFQRYLSDLIFTKRQIFFLFSIMIVLPKWLSTINVFFPPNGLITQ